MWIIIPRLARKNLNTPFLHVMVQGTNKEYIFNTKEQRDKYLEIINKCKDDYKITIMAYCIMNNHAHLLIYVENIEELGQFMHKINLIYAQDYNKSKGRCGVIFRNRYQTEPIYESKYLINCIKYIHNNPVKAGMVSRCEEYQYSTYREYINNCGVTKSKIMIELFGEKCNYQKLFKENIEKRYMDIERIGTSEYIANGIKEFCKQKGLKIVEILIEREILKELISFLYKSCGIKYVEIREYFDISRGTMDALKIE